MCVMAAVRNKSDPETYGRIVQGNQRPAEDREHMFGLLQKVLAGIVQEINALIYTELGTFMGVEVVAKEWLKS